MEDSIAHILARQGTGEKRLYVKKEMLNGFRSPTASEQQKVAEQVRKTYARDMRPTAIWNAFFTAIAVIFLINLIGMGKERFLGANMVYILFFFAAAAAAFLSGRSKKKGKTILKMIAAGQYQVMDCRAYDVSYNVSLMSTAGIKVVNSQGQYCGSSFLVDKGIARKCEKDKNTRLLLIKCSEDFYDFVTK